jgi:hypothetical protein
MVDAYLIPPIPGDLLAFLCFFYSSTPQTPRETKDFMKGGDFAMAVHDIVGIGALVPGGVSRAASIERSSRCINQSSRGGREE